MTTKLAIVAPLLALAAIIAVAAIFLSSSPHASAGAPPPNIATIGIDVIGGDANGNVVTPCTAAGDPNVDYPCNNSTALGPIDNCVALTSAAGASHTTTLDVVGISIPLGGTNGSNQSGQGAGQSDMALNWTPNGTTLSPIAVTAIDWTAALIEQGDDNNGPHPGTSGGGHKRR